MATDDHGRAAGGPPGLAEAFRSLSTQHQDALWATAVEGLAPQAVAERLGIAPIAVSVLAYRAAERVAAAYVEAELRADPPGACRAVLPLLPSLARDALPPDDEQAVRAHLDGCRACQERLGVLSDVGAALAGRPAERRAVLTAATGAPPSDVPFVPVTAVGPAARASHPPPARRPGGSRRRRWSAVLATLGVLLVAGVAAANLTGSGGDARLTADQRATTTTDRATPTSSTGLTGATSTSEETTTTDDGGGGGTTTTRSSTTSTPGQGGATTTEPPGTTAVPSTGATTTTRATTTTAKPPPPTTTTTMPTTTTKPPVADLGVVASFSDGVVTVTVTNNGPDAARDVELVLAKSPTVLLSAGGAGWSCSGGILTNVRCHRESMSVGSSTVTATVSGLPGSVTASVSATSSDPVSSNNSAPPVAV